MIPGSRGVPHRGGFKTNHFNARRDTLRMVGVERHPFINYVPITETVFVMVSHASGCIALQPEIPGSLTSLSIVTNQRLRRKLKVET